MNTKWKIILPLLASLCVITGLFIGRWMYKTPSAFMSSGSSPVDEVLNLADHEYTDSVNMDTLSEAAIEAMLSLLDPHSVYIPKKDLQMVNDDMSGSFSGIGVQFNIQRDTVTIISVIHGGPSEKLGILPGDRIISVDGKPFVGKSLERDGCLDAAGQERHESKDRHPSVEFTEAVAIHYSTWGCPCQDG